ncbi:MAG: polysaccharide deacetylase family protein [Hadesarchaea archaeon]|nr:polysaccharide deacetylase family protein [Hadesarchaea archaeon]
MNSGCGVEGEKPRDEIKLIMRCDDLGFCHSANLAFEKVYKEGILTSAEIMVTPPWFNEAVEIARKNPKLDLGLHLVLTSEWQFYSCGPILSVTEVPSLVDNEGHFFPSKRSFLAARPKPAEVEKELRAQIEKALKKGLNISHLSTHMFAAKFTPKLKAITKKLSAEYKLPISGDVGEKRGEWLPTYDVPHLKKEKVLAGILKKLTPGLWMIVNHPGLDTPEMRAMKTVGLGEPGELKHVAAHRAAETKALTSKRIKQIIKNRKIKLISYRDILG